MPRRSRLDRRRRDRPTPGDLYDWISNATETGDRDLWPRILELYQEHPGLRWITLSHIPCYWQAHPDLVVPLLCEALHDRRLFDVALHAAAEFSELEDKVASCLRGALCDPERFDRTVTSAARLPALADALVACLVEPQIQEKVGSVAVIGALAELFGLVTYAEDFGFYARAVQEDILQQVQAELRRRCGADGGVRLSLP